MTRFVSAAWLVGLVVTIWGLFDIESAQVPLPPITSLLDWVNDHDPVTVVLGLLRALCLIGVVYLGAATVVVWSAHVIGNDRLIRLVTGVCGASLSGFVTRLVGLSVVGALGASSPASADEVPMLRSLTPVAAPTHQVSDVHLRQSWTVAPGDNLWSIAQHVLSERSNRVATEAEVVAYWSELARVNLGSVPDPDVIHPGTELTLPG